MLQRPSLLIFIDSLSFTDLQHLPQLSQWVSRQPLQPGFGYSVNIKAEMFAGLTADEFGFFNEWYYTTSSRLRRFAPWFRLISWAERSYLLDRVLHRLGSRLVHRNILNIPFRYLAHFDYVGLYPYDSEFPYPNLFSQVSDLQTVLYRDISHTPQRDEQLFRKAEQVVRSGAERVFVASADLDHLGHIYGPGSSEHQMRLLELDQWIANLAAVFLQLHPKGSVVVFSDHGMSSVTQEFRLDLERHFGRCAPDRYFYFLDSTLLRVWAFEPGLSAEISAFLKDQQHAGELLNDETRKEYGVTNPEFGTHLFLLNEGTVFIPSFFGRKRPLGMHGYRPDLLQQTAVLATAGEPVDTADIQRTIDLYRLFQRL